MRISDWSSDVCSSDLWKSAFVNSVRQGLVNQANFVVINCDFNQYMWDSRASGCLAGQLTNFINQRGITDLVVITHSNGGNIMRWILSNPTWDARYQIGRASCRERVCQYV